MRVWCGFYHPVLARGRARRRNEVEWNWPRRKDHTACWADESRQGLVGQGCGGLGEAASFL